MTSGDDGYYDARDAFRAADDHCEKLFEQAVAAVNAARVEDQLCEALDGLAGDERQRLAGLFAERGQEALLSGTSNGLASLIRRVRKLAAAFSAARELNTRRRSLAAFEFEESLGNPPVSVEAAVWQEQVRAFNERVDAMLEGDADLEQDDAYREAAFELENGTRSKYDGACEQLIDQLRALLESGRFDVAVHDLNANDRKFAREFCTYVPQVQKQPQPERQGRPVMLAEPETDTDALIDEINDFLNGH